MNKIDEDDHDSDALTKQQLVYVFVFIVGLMIAWGAWVTRQFSSSDKQLEHVNTVQNNVVSILEKSETRLRTLEQIVAQDRAWGEKINELHNELNRNSEQMSELKIAVHDQELRCRDKK